MPRRNLLIIFLAAVLSVVCYHRAARNPYVATLTEVMNTINTQYIDPVDSRVLFEGALDGMIAQLDANSAYVNPREYRQLREDLDQVFGGVGIVVELHPETERLTVMTPLVGTPAHKAGVRSGDQIMAINDQDTKGMTLEDAVRLMRGPEGSDVKLSILNEGAEKPYDVTLERARIPIESVLGDLRRKDGSWIYRLHDHPEIGYIRLTNFGNETAEELREALQSYREPGNHIEALILDLRGNAGGLLEAAVKSCDLFLDEGTIVSTRGRGGVEQRRISATPGVEIGHEIPMVVLVDKFSASASEIVAACLQDHGRAVVGGERSWGKGTVQNVLPLEGNRSALRLTIASYWRPSGQDIHKRKDAKPEDAWGVRPEKELEVNLTNEQFAQIFKARRERDLLTIDASGEPMPAVPPDDSKEKETPAAVEDLQLKRAVEYLQPNTKPQPGEGSHGTTRKDTETKM